MSTSPMDLLEPGNSFEADETAGSTSMNTITNNNNGNTPAAERTLGLERGNTMEGYNIPAPWPAGMGGMDASDLQTIGSMPQAEFDLLNAQLGLSFDPFLSFDFGTTSTSASTSNYPLGTSGSAGGNFGNMTTSFNEQGPAFLPPQLQQQAVPGPSNYFQAQEQSRTALTDGSASGSKSWHTGRTDHAPPRRANPNRVDLDDDEASSEDLDDEDATYDPFDDPIYLRYVTLEQAERLFGTFMRQLNILMAMFEPEYHTFDKIRSSSPFLFTIMICLAARFSHDDRRIYQTLYPHAKSLLHKAMNEGHCHVTTVQAISCFVFWGLPRESKQTWQRLGHAIRLAYQLGMHVPRTSDLPLDDAEAKAILNRERTWYALSVVRSRYSRIERLPQFMKSHEFLDPRLWVTDRPGLHKDLDWHLCMYMSVTIQIMRLGEAARIAPITESQIERLESELTGIYNRYKEGRMAVPDQNSDLKATPMWYFDHMLRLSRLRYRHHPSQESLLDCHRWAVLYLDTMAGLDRFGFFHAIHDIQNRVYFSTGRYLLSLHEEAALSATARSETLHVIEQARALYQKYASQDAGGAMAVQLQRFQKLSKRIA
ncbi:hypothetical protein FFLO_04400 [Filobasidium floriforme]|uniref:Xylanolytic transcriptional activator regulatory domain-containing protein n=1 Tax=Filobasidium floriforme TaxID=5210 RepID=A0A8K0JJB0_9TREE|nr:hypothetical protein FFLO_04400 [Filobasidium floriforme]